MGGRTARVPTAEASSGSVLQMPESKGSADVLRFFGHSDDCAEYEGPRNDVQEQYVNEHGMVVWDVTNGGHALQVVAYYGKNGCWSMGVRPFEENLKLPPWPMRFETHENGYSAVLVLEAPPGTNVRRGSVLG